jgi:D-alanyl-D-alanine carboxypeptidase
VSAPKPARTFQLLAGDGVAGAAVRVEQLSTGELLFESAAGDLRQGARAMRADDRFHLASIAKTMTAALVLQLAEEGAFGKEGLDATLVSTGTLTPVVVDQLLLVDGQSVGHALTLRHLLTHTGGLRDAMVDDHEQLGGPAPASLIGALMSQHVDPRHRWRPWDPAHPAAPEAGVLNWYLNEVAPAGLSHPGQGFHYSDTGFVLLGLVVEHLSGLPLHEALQQRIFAPLNLQRTYLAYVGDPPNLGPDRLPESEPWMGSLPCLSLGLSLSFDWGGGGVVSTAAELAAFHRALLQGRLFRSPASLQAMTAWQQPLGLKAPRSGVGLGLFRTEMGGHTWVGHSGAWGCKMFAAPAADLLVTGTLNRADAPDDWHAQLATAVLASTH